MSGLSQSYRHLLVTYLKPQRIRVLWLSITLLGGIGLQVLNPQILRYFIDTAVAGGSQQTLVITALGFVAIAVLHQGLTLAATYFSELVAWTATNHLRLDLAKHCFNLDLAFHKAHTPGELVERVDGDIDALSRFFSQFVLQVLGNGLLVIGILGILWLEDWRAGLSLSLFALIALGILAYLQTLAVQPWRSYRQISAQFYGFVVEYLGGLEDIRANGAVSYVMQQFYRIFQRWLAAFHKARFTSTLLWSSTVGLFTVGNAIALAVGAYLWQRNAITIGTVYLLFYYATLLQEPIERIREELEQFQKAAASLYRIQDLLAQQSHIHPGGQAILPSGALSVEFRNVWFRYGEERERVDGWMGRREGARGSEDDTGTRLQPAPNTQTPISSTQKLKTKAQNPTTSDQFLTPNHQQPTINNQPSTTNHQQPTINNPSTHPPSHTLHNLTFRLPAGQTLGLLGRTGSGKSTLVKLLLRLYDIQQGQICLGGIDISQVALAELPHHIGFVTQDVQLFQTTVRNNLTFFNPHIPDAAILQTLAELGLSPWLEALPQGLDTELGADSGGLSAGQAQLLAFARVFLKDPGLVVLDEASSRLDPLTEQLIEQAVDRLLKNRTGIIIAHRLKTVERADQILILEQGQIVEYGDRTSLMNDPDSRFARLLQTGAVAKQL